MHDDFRKKPIVAYIPIKSDRQNDIDGKYSVLHA